MNIYRVAIDGLHDEVSDTIVSCLSSAITTKGSACLVAAGGTSFIEVYRRLSLPKYRNDLDWTKVTILTGDERCVPLDDPESNAGMLIREWIDVMERAERPKLLVMDTAVEAEKAAKDYESVIPERIDMALLGLGPDGHSASLFPASRDIWNAARLAVTVPAGLPPFVQRITLTPAAFKRADRAVVMATGKGKSEILQRAFSAIGGSYPINDVLRHIGRVDLYADASALSLLQPIFAEKNGPIA